MTEVRGLKTYQQKAFEHISEKSSPENKGKSYELPLDLFTQEEIAFLENRIPDFTEKVLSPAQEQLFGSEAAETLIAEEIQKAYQEFTTHLKKRGVDEAYVQEIGHVTPLSEIKYTRHGKDAEAKQHGIEQSDTGIITIDTTAQDATKRTIEISASILIHTFDLLRKIPIFEQFDDAFIRTLAIKLLTYHELTHSLQQAYLNQNGTYRSGLLIDRVKGSKLTKALPARYEQIDSEGDFSEEIESEKQAEGIANDALLTVLGYGPDLMPLLEAVPVQVAESWLRRKRITTERVTDDPTVIGIKGLLNLYLQHSNKIDVPSALNKILRISSPKIRQALESNKVNYWYGLLFPRSRRALKEVYTVLATPPSKLAPARKNPT